MKSRLAVFLILGIQAGEAFAGEAFAGETISLCSLLDARESFTPQLPMDLGE